MKIKSVVNGEIVEKEWAGEKLAAGPKHYTQEVYNALKEKYTLNLMDEDFFRLSRKKQAELIGVDHATLQRWLADGLVDWESITKKYREAYGKFKPLVDGALIRNAIKGKEKSIEMFYQRFDGWNPRGGIDITVKRDYSNSDVLEMARAAFNTLTPEQKENLLEQKTEAPQEEIKEF